MDTVRPTSPIFQPNYGKENLMKLPQLHNMAWHRENCPCKGREQEKSARLRARQKESMTGVSGFRKPGSQNRNK